jgi:hypothetical protein
MRRTIPIDFPDDSNKATTIPSTPVVGMFGRLFGTILATLLKTNIQELSVVQNQLSNIISEIRTNFEGLKNESQRSVFKQDVIFIVFSSEKDKFVNELKDSQ